MEDSRLQKIIQYAAENVPYYQRMFSGDTQRLKGVISKEDLVRLPVITKNQLQENTKDFYSSEYFRFPKSELRLASRTSGSTGKSLKIYWDKHDMIRSLFYLWKYRNSRYGISAASKFCSFHSVLYDKSNLVQDVPDFFIGDGGRNLSFSKLVMDDIHLSEYYGKLMDFKPEWMFLQPSVAYILADFISRNSLKIPEELKYIELTGEYLFKEYRAKISDVFKVPIANMYGAIETNGIAFECRYGHMHCLQDNVVIEVLNGEKIAGYGEEGEVHITNLYNKAMPFIRYALGDRVTLYPGEMCKCGSKSDILEIKAGRISDYVRIKGRETINSYLFVYSIESINERLGYPILQFYIVQESDTCFSSFLVVHNAFRGWKDTIKLEFMEEMKKLKLDMFDWNISFEDKLSPNKTTGKFRFFESKVCTSECVTC